MKYPIVLSESSLQYAYTLFSALALIKLLFQFESQTYLKLFEMQSLNLVSLDFYFSFLF